MPFTPPDHTPYQWHNAPATDTPLDSTHLQAAETDLVSYTKAVIESYDSYASGQFLTGLPNSVVSDSRSGGAVGVDSTGITTGQILEYNGTKVVPVDRNVVAPLTVADLPSGFTNLPMLAHTLAGSPAGANVTTAAIDTSAVFGVSVTVIVVAVAWLGTATPSITDSKGNAWTKLTTHTSGDNSLSLVFYWTHPTSVGTGHTFSTTFTGSQHPAIAVAAFEGFPGARDLDLGATANATSVQPGSGTPFEAGELILTAAACNASSDGYTVDSGFVITDRQVPIASGSPGLALAFLPPSTAHALNPTWTGTGASAQRVAVMAGFEF